MSVSWRFEGDFDEIFKAALQHRLEEVRAELDQVRCPIHGASPLLVVTSHTAGGISVDVQGCCEELGRATTARLKALGFENDA
jgi:hypothetical protein